MPPTAIDNGDATSGCLVDGGGGSLGPAPGTSVTCTPPPNSVFPIGKTLVTCTATNALGHTSPASTRTFTVSVVDRLGPVFSPSTVGPITVRAPGTGGSAVTFAPIATDQVDDNPTSCSACGSPLPSAQLPPAPPDPPWAPQPLPWAQTPRTCDPPLGSEPITCTPASGSQFPVGTTMVTCTAADSAKNVSSTTFPVTVLETAPSVSISSSFQPQPIAAGDTLWFTSVIKVHGLTGKKVHLYLDGSQITFTAGSTGTAIPVPPAVVTLDPSASVATTTYDRSSGQWETTLPVNVEGYAFLAGVELPVTAALPGKIRPVTWSGQFAADATGLTVDWAWAAAAYQGFATDYDALGVEPVDGHGGGDPAGTPEQYKQDVVHGATGEGNHDYTGKRSDALRVGPL
jgi:hypothetical protein